MFFKTDNFLRRTFLLAAAAAGLASFCVPSLAQQVKKDDGTVICSSYGGITVAPNGGIVVTSCSGSTVTPPPTTTPPPAAGNFQVDASSITTLNASQWGTVWISRTGGSTGAVNANLSVSGGCVLGSSFVTFGDGVTANQGVGVGGPATPATCTVTVVNATNGGAVGTPATATILVAGGLPSNNNGTPSNCPAVPPDAVSLSLGQGAASQWLMKSGVVGYAPLPYPATYLFYQSARVITNDSTATWGPNGVREITFSKCPGVIDPNAGMCYWRAQGSGSAINNDWFEAPGTNPSSTDSLSTSAHVCEAYHAQGTWYMNIRYTYAPSDCPWGTCGLTGQWNFGPYSP